MVNVVNNATSAAYTTGGDVDDHSECKQHDVTVPMAAIGQTDELSIAEIVRIVSLSVIFLVGFVCNMFVLILVIWKRSRKQVSLLDNSLVITATQYRILCVHVCFSGVLFYL
jgi:hypothetical protein